MPPSPDNAGLTTRTTVGTPHAFTRPYRNFNGGQPDGPSFLANYY